jgi:hypothetical protein
MRDILYYNNKIDERMVTRTRITVNLRRPLTGGLLVINFPITRVAKLDITRAMNREEAA